MEQSKESNVQEHTMLDGKPRLQLMGQKLDTIQATLYVHASFQDPATISRQLNLYIESGEIVPLITGAGDVVGTYVITSSKTSSEMWGGDGKILSATISLDLREAVAVDTAGVDGFAQSTWSPPIITPPAVQQESLESIAAANVTAVGVQNNSILSNVKSASITPAAARNPASNTLRASRLMRANYATLTTAADAVVDSPLYDATRDAVAYISDITDILDLLDTTAESLIVNIDAADDAAALLDIAELLTQSAALDLATREFRRLSVPFITLYATRK